MTEHKRKYSGTTRAGSSGLHFIDCTCGETITAPILTDVEGSGFYELSHRWHVHKGDLDSCSDCTERDKRIALLRADLERASNTVDGYEAEISEKDKQIAYLEAKAKAMETLADKAFWEHQADMLREAGYEL
jgi:hypothetical protein